jgi:anti-anti-sigma regulatory factor
MIPIPWGWGSRKRAEMSIQNPPEDLIVANLPFKEPQIGNELESLNKIIGDNPECDVIIDFSKVEIITSSSLSNLLILRKLLSEQGHRLIFCNVAVVTKCIFNVAGLDEIFEFANDKPAAVATVHSTD